MAAIHGGTDEQAIAYCQKGGDFWQGGTRVVLKGRKERQGQRNGLEGVRVMMNQSFIILIYT